MQVYELRIECFVARREYQLQHGVSSRVRDAMRGGLGFDIVGDPSWLFLGDINRLALILERTSLAEESGAPLF